MRSRSALICAVFVALLAHGLTNEVSAAVGVDCVVPDTAPPEIVQLPPDGCEYLSPQDVHMLVSGLPIGTDISIGVEHAGFEDVIQTYVGSGFEETFDSTLELNMTGTGILDGFERTILMTNVQVATTTGARVVGVPFPTEMTSLEGQLVGDPDFDLLTIRAGADFGLPSPGQTTLTPTNSFIVDSFFDVTYEIEFVGAPGSQLEGLAGTTGGTIRMEASGPAPAVPASLPWGRSALFGLLAAALAAGAYFRRRRATA